MRSRIFFGLASAAVVLASGAACASPSDEGRPSPGAATRARPSAEPTDETSTLETKQTEPSASTIEAEIVDTDFAPPRITVDAGAEVKWTQVGDQPHSVTAADDLFDSSPKCSPLDSDKCLGQDDTFSYVFTRPGTYIYYCRVHGLPDGTGMAGEIVVK